MKFYVVTRKDLTDAQQAVQSTHAAVDYCIQYPTQAGPWNKKSNYLVLLAVDKEPDLQKIIQRCREMRLTYSAFYEPDIDNQLTAVAIEPTQRARKIVKRLPLILKND